MATYNAAKHTIETDDGQTTLAQLTLEVRANDAFHIADGWGAGLFKENEQLNKHVEELNENLDDAEGEIRDLKDEIIDIESDLDKANERIAELEAQLATKEEAQ